MARRNPENEYMYCKYCGKYMGWVSWNTLEKMRKHIEETHCKCYEDYYIMSPKQVANILKE